MVNMRTEVENMAVEGTVRGVAVALTNKITTTASQAVAVGTLEEQVAQIMVMTVLTTVAHTEEKDMIVAPVDTRVGERGMVVVQAECQMVEETAAQLEETTVVQTSKVSNGMEADGISSPVKWLNI